MFFRNMIKKLFIFALFSFVSIFSFAQIKEYKLSNEIPVYINNMIGSRIDCLYVLFDGGVVYLSPEFSGLEDAAVKMLISGSKQYSHQDNEDFRFDKQVSFSSFSGQTGSGISMTCIDKYFDETFSRFIDGLLNPAWEKEPYEDLIRSYRQNIQATMNEPSSLVFYYADLLNYSGHPYETFSNPTIDSISNITLENIKRHYKSLIDSRRLKVVVCGNFDEEKLVSKLEQTLSSVKRQNYSLIEKNVPPLKIHGENGLFVHAGASGSGFLLRTFESPSYFSEDYPLSILASSIFDDIMFNVVREKNGICYTPSSGIYSSPSGFGYEFLYRTTNLEAFPEALEEARNILLSGKVISGKDNKGNYILQPLESKLEAYKNRYVTNKYQRQTTTSGIAGRICASLLAFDDPEAVDRITEKAMNADSEKIIEVFKKYWIDSPERWFCVTGADGQEKLEKTLERIK